MSIKSIMLDGLTEPEVLIQDQLEAVAGKGARLIEARFAMPNGVTMIVMGNNVPDWDFDTSEGAYPFT